MTIACSSEVTISTSEIQEGNINITTSEDNFIFELNEYTSDDFNCPIESYNVTNLNTGVS